MRVQTGLESLLHDIPVELRTGRVGLVTNAAAVTRQLESAFDALREAGLNIVALFSPEHGFFAAAPPGDKVDTLVDARTGIPIYSLYGESVRPTPEMLEGLTHLVVDLPIVGARFFTYESTLFHVMMAAAEADIDVVVLDRPNPITGVYVEGPILQDAYRSFVGMLPIPTRHGMTLGELGRMANDVLGIGVRLTVIPATGWTRDQWFDATGLPWAPPSPNMPSLDTATVYPGTCWVEGTTLSEGRGTPLPFQVVGAPGLDGYALAGRLNALELPGVRFRPVQFIPSIGKHKDTLCEGVQIHVLDREAFRPVRTVVALLAAVRDQDRNALMFLPSRVGGLLPFDRLVGNEEVRRALMAGVAWQEIVAPWEQEEMAFRAQRRRWLLYDET